MSSAFDRDSCGVIIGTFGELEPYLRYQSIVEGIVAEVAYLRSFCTRELAGTSALTAHL